jgi:hypothetical protein
MQQVSKSCNNEVNLDTFDPMAAAVSYFRLWDLASGCYSNARSLPSMPCVLIYLERTPK